MSIPSRTHIATAILAPLRRASNGKSCVPVSILFSSTKGIPPWSMRSAPTSALASTPGEACLVIATQAHREDLEARLTASGIDPATARSQRLYVALDAAETLASFMCAGAPDPERF